MKASIMLLALAMLIAVAPALAGASTTVTLNSYCSVSKLPSATQVVFHIANIGNGTAFNVSVAPNLYSTGLNMSPSSASLSSLLPGTNASTGFNITSYRFSGSYAIGFTVLYTQVSAALATIFPCTVNIGARPQSEVEIVALNYSKGKIKASLVNLANKPLPVSLYVIAPQNVYVGNRYSSATLQPGVLVNETFNVTIYPPAGVTNATYDVSIATSYVENNVSYSGYSTVIVPENAPHSASFPWAAYAVVAVIAALIALITFSFVAGRRRRNAHAHAEAKADPAQPQDTAP